MHVAGIKQELPHLNLQMVCIGPSYLLQGDTSLDMQEYEKRLLAKDHEIKVAQANARELQKRLNQASAELANSSRMATPQPAPAQGAPTCATS